MKSRFLALILTATLLVSACGFHLKGQKILPPELHTLYLAYSHFDPLARELESRLTASGARITSKERDAPVTLKIINQNKHQQATTVGASQQTREYTLSYSVSFALLDSAGKTLAGPYSAHQQRNQVLQSSQILGATSQTEDLYDDMLKEIVSQIIDRLGSQSVRESLDKNKAASQ